MKSDSEFQKQTHIQIQERVAESNQIIAKTLIAFAIISFGIFILFQTGFLKSKGEFVYITLIAMPIIFLFSGIVCLLKKGKGILFPYLFFVLLAFFWLMFEMMSGFKGKMLLPILILLSLRYYNKTFTLFTYAICVLALLASNFCNAYLYKETGLLDLNLFSLPTGGTLSFAGNMIDEVIALNPDSDALFVNGLRLSFLPNFIILSVIVFISIRFMRYNLKIIVQAEELAGKEAKQRLELNDLKTKTMLSQIKPHFIYNALSSIAMYCTENPQKAQDLTLDFSDYLRNNLESLNENSHPFCTFEKELEHIQSYLNIEKCRFEEKLNIEYDIAIKDFEVPSLSIQPIVENAVKHGVSKKKEGGTVKISTKEEKDGYWITIQDDGVGFDRNRIHDDGKIHVGLENIEKRLALFGGRFEIDSTVGVGTIATVFIPKRMGIA